jgi:hypothetical protein
MKFKHALLCAFFLISCKQALNKTTKTTDVQQKTQETELAASPGVPKPLSWKTYAYDLTLKIMQFHEAKFGIEYDAPVPDIIFDDKMNIYSVGIYNPRHVAIILHGRFASYNIARLLEDLEHIPEDNERPTYELEGILPQLFPNNKTALTAIREIISHELGHYYTHLYLERNISNSWLASHFLEYENAEFKLEHIAHYLVIEGIGEYFGKCFDHPYTGVRFAKESWAQEWHAQDFEESAFRRWLQYMGGFDLIEPILSTCGVNDGMKWLFSNELIISIPDISVVLEYQKNALHPN